MSQDNMDPMVETVTSVVGEIFKEHRSTGARQRILAGVFEWLTSEEGADMSPGEVRSAIRSGCSEILDYKF